MTHNSLQLIKVIATVLPFFFAEASPATAFPGSSGGTFIKDWEFYGAVESDAGPSIEERAILFLEARDRVRKDPLFKSHFDSVKGSSMGIDVGLAALNCIMPFFAPHSGIQLSTGIDYYPGWLLVSAVPYSNDPPCANITFTRTRIPVGPVFLSGLLALAIIKQLELLEPRNAYLEMLKAECFNLSIFNNVNLKGMAVIVLLGIKKYRGLNSNDGGNTEDGVKIAGGKDEDTGGIILSVEFSEELKGLLSDEVGK
ncbi:hypothetical protein Tco_0271930 [Tanacetum coccineum]